MCKCISSFSSYSHRYYGKDSAEWDAAAERVELADWGRGKRSLPSSPASSSSSASSHSEATSDDDACQRGSTDKRTRSCKPSCEEEGEADNEEDDDDPGGGGGGGGVKTGR